MSGIFRKSVGIFFATLGAAIIVGLVALLIHALLVVIRGPL